MSPKARRGERGSAELALVPDLPADLPRWDPSDDSQVIDAARQGDPQAITLVYQRINPRLRRYLRAHAPHDADDIGGDVWMAVARNLPTFQGDWAGLRSWVFTIAANRVADHRRKAARRKTDAVAPDRFPELGNADDPAAITVARISGQRAADLLVGLLPPDQADVVLLRVLGEMTADEVAEALGRSATWVRVAQHRAVRTLNERLDRRTL